jgi:hypothetical protein
MKRPDLSTVAIVLVLLALLVPTSASPGDDIDNSGLVVAPSNGANGAYAELDQNGELAISLDGSALPSAGSGANPNAKSVFKDVFTVSNQGNGGLAVWTSDGSKDVIFQLDGTGRSIEDPTDCVYLAPGDSRTIGILVEGGASTGTLLKSFNIRAREAVPGDCPDSTTPTPTPETPTPTPSTPTATPGSPATPTPGGGSSGGGDGPGAPAQGPEETPTGSPTAEPNAPTANFEVRPPSDFVCGPVRFDARPSDSETRITGYEWIFPEGSATGPSVEHSFTEPGEADVSLTVEDAAGRRSTVTRTFVVNDRPSVQVIRPANADADRPVRLVANVTDRYGDIRGIYWRFRDGSTKSGETVTHTFSEGRHPVEVRAIDSCGAEGRTTVTIEAAARGPVETAVDAVNSGIPFVVRSAAVALLAPILFALDRRRKGRRRRR